MLDTGCMIQTFGLWYYDFFHRPFLGDQNRHNENRLNIVYINLILKTSAVCAKSNVRGNVTIFYCSHIITVPIEPFDTSDDDSCGVHDSA